MFQFTSTATVLLMVLFYGITFYYRYVLNRKMKMLMATWSRMAPSDLECLRPV